jgi:hypothetical protein
VDGEADLFEERYDSGHRGIAHEWDYTCERTAFVTIAAA